MAVTGGKKLKAYLKAGKAKPKVTGVRIGFFATAKYPDGTPVTNVAAYNEFGTKPSSKLVTVRARGKVFRFKSGGIPKRPFMRYANRTGRPKVRRLLRKLVKGKTLNVTLQDARLIGLLMKREIQQSIRQLRTPPNSPLTKLLKGSSNPLINTGFMRRAVDFEIIKGGLL